MASPYSLKAKFRQSWAVYLQKQKERDRQWKLVQDKKAEQCMTIIDSVFAKNQERLAKQMESQGVFTIPIPGLKEIGKNILLEAHLKEEYGLRWLGENDFMVIDEIAPKTKPIPEFNFGTYDPPAVVTIPKEEEEPVPALHLGTYGQAPIVTVPGDSEDEDDMANLYERNR